MENLQVASLAHEALTALDTSTQRDELLACLDFIGQSQQDKPDLLSLQTLASFPAWLEVQGFSASLLGTFFQHVDRIVTPLRPPETLHEIYSSLGLESSILQLVDAVAERSPIVYEVLIQTIEQACQSVHELGAVGGGMSTKGKIELGVGVTLTFLVGVGLLKKRRANPAPQRNPEFAGAFIEGQPAVLHVPDQADADAIRLNVERDVEHVDQRVVDAEREEEQRIIEGNERIRVYKDGLREQSAYRLALARANDQRLRVPLDRELAVVEEDDAEYVDSAVSNRLSEAGDAVERSFYQSDFSRRVESDVESLVEEEVQDVTDQVERAFRSDIEEMDQRGAEDFRRHGIIDP